MSSHGSRPDRAPSASQPRAVETIAYGSCETKRANNFKKSNTFLCVSADNSDISEVDAVAMKGNVTKKGKNIKKGQVVLEDGFSYIYTCKLVAFCAL